MTRIFLALGLTLSLTSSASANDQDAIRISEHTRQYHMPYGHVAGTIGEDPTNHPGDIYFYLDVGDTALWTGTYLAAESFRYSVLRDQASLDSVKHILNGIRMLVDAKGDGYLARSTWPVNGAYVKEYVDVEGRYGLGTWTFNGEPYYWQAGVTRDQYCGVYFGLAAAFDLVDDADVHAVAVDLVTRMTDYLIRHNWTLQTSVDTSGNIGHISTTFLHRPEQRLSMLQVARHMNPGKFQKAYETEHFWHAWLAGASPGVETWDLHGGYYKFNLDFMYFYNLIRLEQNPDWKKSYLKQYSDFRQKLANHGNAHFNMIDRVLRGPDPARDQETREIIDQRLLMGFLNRGIDLRGKYKACKDGVACDPVPFNERLIDGFMWQRSPYELYYEGDPRIEGDGVDYLTPYWMARALGVL